eukprot:m.358992 g.358992  ORF g.358992 m.358992 type:complete len:1196 (+) comp18362_c0_seq1:186-3773(+)
MASAVVEPAHVFGLKSNVADNICYLDEQNILYPAGSSVVIYNVAQKTQRFIHASDESQGFTALAVSPNRRYVAIAERATHAAVTIYDLHSLKKRKFLSDSTSSCTEFVNLAFSPDSKYLVTLGGAPEWNMYYWAWEKSQGPMAVTKCSLDPAVAVYRATFNPQDNTHICVTGNNTLKMFRYTEGHLKQLAFQKLESHNYLGQAWLADDALVAGTEEGKILLFVGGELKTQITLADRITCIAPTSTGFMCGTASGSVVMYQQTDDDELFKQVREVVLPSSMTEETLQGVHHIALSPSEEIVTVSTNLGQIYTTTVTPEVDVFRSEDTNTMKLLSHLFHHDQITGLDVAVRKPLIATTSLDCSIRVWNYHTHALELVKYFSEAAYSVAIHPSGLFVLVGFGDKLRLMNLLMDDIRPFREFSIRECRECRFSNGGHVFAAAQGNIIQLYSTWTFQNIASLKGHNGRIKSLAWSADDTKLVSCGSDGAVYEWNVLLQHRDSESVLKSCHYTCAALAPDGENIYAVGSDKSLKHIVQNSIELEVPASANNDVVLTQVALSHAGRFLVTGTNKGAVRAYKFPLELQAEWSTLTTHHGAVTRMCISPDDGAMFSVGEDGCLFMYKLSDKEGRGTKRRGGTDWADEILITKVDLTEKNTTMAELQRRVEELQMASEYQLRLKDMNYTEKMKDMDDKFTQEKDELRRQLEQLKLEKEKEDARHDQEVSELQDAQLQAIQALEHQHNQKLMVEYEKYQKLQQRSQQMQERYEAQIEDMAQGKELALKDLASFWETKLREKSSALDAAGEDLREQERETDEVVRQIELDADKEIQEIKLRYEKLLREEQERTLQLKGDNGILGKKFKSLQGEIEEQKAKQVAMQAEQQKLHAHIKALEREILSGKKEIEERDETIQDKEKRIYDLKKKNQELEKFKFVLDYKIKELKKQIEPKDNDIQSMRAQIAEMDAELERYSVETKTMSLKVEELEHKLRVASTEGRAHQARVKVLENGVTRFRSELQTAVGFIQNPKQLADSVRELHRKHCVEMADVGRAEEDDTQEEQNRQRKFLERNTAALQKKLAASEKARKQEVAQVRRENVQLIKEINELRKELFQSKGQVHKLEGTLHTTRTLATMRGQTLPSEAATEAMAGLASTSVLQQHDMQQTERIIDMQKDEIRRLREELKTQTLRPGSTGRLPPMSPTTV